VPDLLERLQVALADRYTIERELGRGGMAIVYLAEDLKHQRKVALKVLRPELAASIGAERFLREITTAAQLTHPNILPLFDSGEADGTLYYTMPYVKGDSLRDRLNREKQFPIEDALQITREVADALGYAHEQGIVHRDIKPENILFQRGHALVADFGIARAVTAAGAETLTETGLAVGTPAYMSPEQGVGSGEVDSRSDLYSLGCVLYELLTGETPYLGNTPQAIIAKKLSEPTPRVSVVRDKVPAAVEAALERMLSRNAVDRFATASEFVAALSVAVDTPRPQRRHGRRLAILAVLAIAVVASGAYGAWWFFTTGKPGTVFATGAMDPGDRVLLADFVNRTDDSTLGYTVQVGIRGVLASSPGLVRLVDPAVVRATLNRMELSPDARLETDVAREVAEREGAKAFVTGEVNRLGSGYQLTVRVVGTADGRELLVEQVNARQEDELMDTVDRLAGRLRRGIGESVRDALTRPSLPQVTTHHFSALQAYATAVHEQYSPSPSAAVTRRALEDAVALDSTFAMAYKLLSDVLVSYWGAAGAAESRIVGEMACRFKDPLPELERLTVELACTRDDWAGQEYLYRRILELDPKSCILTSFSDFRLKQRRFPEAEVLARRALEAGCTNFAAYHNLLEALAAQRQFALADSVVAEMPLGRARSDSRSRLLWASRDLELTEEYLAQWLSETTNSSDSLDIKTDLIVLSLMRGRLEEADERLSWSRSDQRLGFVYGARRLAWIWETNTDRRRRLLAETLDHYGWDTLPAARRGYHLVIPVLAQVGRTADANAFLAEWADSLPGDPRWNSDRWESLGWIAFAEGRLETALVAFRRWHDAPFANAQHIYSRGLAEAGLVYDRLDQRDSAIALFERALATPSLAEGYVYEVRWYPFVLRRLGELHESLGHGDEAIDYYSRFIDLWKDADPELQSQVEEARAAVARLMEEPR